MCRDENDEFVAVEIKRVGTIDAVEQLTRYLERICEEPGLHRCRGVLAAQAIKPQARTLAESRGIECVEVDLAVLKGDARAGPDAVRARRHREAALAHPALDLGDHRLDHLHARVALVVALHELPRRVRVLGPLEHVLDRLRVLRPLLAVAPVLVGDLPALQRVLLALLEALELLLVGDVQPELHEHAALDAERALEARRSSE